MPTPSATLSSSSSASAGQNDPASPIPPGNPPPTEPISIAAPETISPLANTRPPNPPPPGEPPAQLPLVAGRAERVHQPRLDRAGVEGEPQPQHHGGDQ